MRKVVLYQLLSLDGVAEEPGDWMFDGDQPIFDNLERVIREQDTVLFGRRTYDYWVDFWPEDGPEPFHTFINETPKHVFTSSPLEKEWANTTAVDGPAVDHVRELKQTDGNSIGIHGSTTLARSLIHAGLVDELRLVVAATLAGHGERLFDGADDLRRLELVDADSTPGGSLLLGYRLSPAD
jgi:dihydrofolate reductase